MSLDNLSNADGLSRSSNERLAQAAAGFRRCTIIHPSSSLRMIWDVLSLLFVAYDLIFIPLQLLDPEDNVVTVVARWMSRIFWSADIIAMCMTGYMRADGNVELRFKYILRRYLLTWAIPDLLLVAVDWVELLVVFDGGAFGVVRAGKAARTFRLLRLLRLVRLIRMRGVLKLITERIQSESLVIIFDILTILTMVVAMAHVIACAWYGIGVREAEEVNWVTEHGLADKSLEFRYTVALHWALLQFGGGTDEVVPHNVGERTFAIVVFIVCFVSAALLVSSLTSSMTQLHILESKTSQKLNTLRRWMRDAGISSGLASRILRNAQHASMEEQRFTPESKVELLSTVSEPLRVELHFEVYKGVFEEHPFFRRYREECNQVMRKVCHLAVEPLIVSKGDVLFHPGEVLARPKVFFVGTSPMQYQHVCGGVFEVTPGQWVAEATLWVSWVHCGALVATSNTTLTTLDARKFREISGAFNHETFEPRVYAEGFVQILNRQGSQNALMDIPFPPLEAEALQEVIDRMGASLWTSQLQDPLNVLPILKKHWAGASSEALRPGASRDKLTVPG